MLGFRRVGSGRSVLRRVPDLRFHLFDEMGDPLLHDLLPHVVRDHHALDDAVAADGLLGADEESLTFQ